MQWLRKNQSLPVVVFSIGSADKGVPCARVHGILVDVRDFLTETNLAKAAFVSLLVTLMGLPRLLEGGKHPGFLAVALFVLGLFLAGSATAWGRRGGLKGLCPGRTDLMVALPLALVGALVLMPLMLGVFDPAIKARLAEVGADARLKLSFPAGTGATLALMCWSAGFEVLFFQAAAMSTCVRLLPKTWFALVMAVALRLFVSYRQFVVDGAGADDLLLYTAPLLVALTASLLYARGGWPAAGLFAFLLSARHLLAAG